MPSAVLPLGLRNHNPGNLRPSLPSWEGQIGTVNNFCVFDSYKSGIRALCKQLMAYQSKYGISTVKGTIERWAPPTDHNDTAAYVTAVCTMLECEPGDRFDFRAPEFLYWMVVAIGSHENGRPFFDAVTDADIDAGIAAALT